MWTNKPRGGGGTFVGSYTTSNQMMEKRRNLKTANAGGSRTSQYSGMPNIGKPTDKPPIGPYSTNDRCKSAAVQNRVNSQQNYSSAQNGP